MINQSFHLQKEITNSNRNVLLKHYVPAHLKLYGRMHKYELLASSIENM